jgi:alkylation response protein AidB-like acyl-CoA dehydrogenase
VTNHLETANLELSLAQTALEEAAEFFRTRPAPPQAKGISKASEDPHIILRFGQLQTRLHAAQGLLARANRLATTDDGSANTALAAVAAIEARAFAADLTAEIVSQAITWGAPLRPRPQSQQQPSPAAAAPAPAANHWRYHDAGNYHLKGTDPRHSTAEPSP